MEAFIYQTVGIAIFLLFPFWRIYKRAGLNPYLTLFLFLPIGGIFITGIILAASKWNISSTSGAGVQHGFRRHKHLAINNYSFYFPSTDLNIRPCCKKGGLFSLVGTTCRRATPQSYCFVGFCFCKVASGYKCLTRPLKTVPLRSTGRGICRAFYGGVRWQSIIEREL